MDLLEPVDEFDSTKQLESLVLGCLEKSGCDVVLLAEQRDEMLVDDREVVILQVVSPVGQSRERLRRSPGAEAPTRSAQHS